MNLILSILLVGLIAVACTTEKRTNTAEGVTLDTIADTNLGFDKKTSAGPDRVIEDMKTDNDIFTEITLTADNLVDEIEDATFNKIIIKNGDKVVFELYDEDAYDTIESKAIKIKNEISSQNLLLQKVKDKYFITLFGAQFGCCARTLTVIQADKNGISKVFKDSFEVHEVSNSSNEKIEYIGIESFSESVGVVDSLDIELFTYNPSIVYTLSDSFKFDSLATKKYNEENYVFAGYNYEGELKVAFPRDRQERRKGTRKPYVYK